MDVTVFGAGNVGLVTGACLAETGNSVVCVDIDEGKVAALRAGRPTMFEPGLEPMVAGNARRGRLRFTTDAELGVGHGDVLFIAVGTPAGENGAADLRHVLAVAADIGRFLQAPKIVVNESTVPVGTADLVRRKIGEALAARNADMDFDVASIPEFQREGAAVGDFMRPDRIVIGCGRSDTREILERLYAPFGGGGNIVGMDARSAELTKYAANVMLATRVSVMNELAGLAERQGADIEAVRRGVGGDSRIGGHFLRAGSGYGGSCLPKDVKALIRAAASVGFEARRRESGGSGQRPPENRAGREDAGALRRSRRSDFRALGPGVQTEYRRHAGSAEPRRDRRAAGGRRRGQGLRSGGGPGGGAAVRRHDRGLRAARRHGLRGGRTRDRDRVGKSSAAPISPRCGWS